MTKTPKHSNPQEPKDPAEAAPRTGQRDARGRSNPVQRVFANHPLFQPGKIVATHGALDLMRRTGTSPQVLLHRHLCGDWSEMDEEDQAVNHDAVQSGARILSSFDVQGVKLWILTEAVSDVTEDGQPKARPSRSSTCYLLPEEY
ncbi:hypothetical protein [Diaphorobacter caeni]|uniref:hypothetical protein n=1 Tax=Diaphorobacter caeni TaxID=2784387 RepID=UPI00188FE74F|nr:hypothetical protein [Diaphorobacter caeni]MBF5004756.1 hypothetical protein [Diaphorobacter caeni]